MQIEDYPGIYQAADFLSQKAQKRFYLALRTHLILLIVATALSIFNSEHWAQALLQAIVFLGILFCSIYLATKRPERLWYAGRAVAESIKTVTWRYITKADPFHTNEADAAHKLRETLIAIVNQNKILSDKLTTHLASPTITPIMYSTRNLSLQDRISFYTNNRIEEQLKWYAKKAEFNSRASEIAFIALISINSVAVLAAITRIGFPSIPYWPTDVFVAISASLLTWMQAKKFSELSASYALTAHEIGIIHASPDLNMHETKFSEFVGDTENAFSREHTQWIARKDS